MSVNSIGGAASQTAPYNAPNMRGAKKTEGGGDNKELTTVTTHCNKDHEHDQSCEATVSTRPAPESSELGNFVDKNA